MLSASKDPFIKKYFNLYLYNFFSFKFLNNLWGFWVFCSVKTRAKWLARKTDHSPLSDARSRIPECVPLRISINDDVFRHVGNFIFYFIIINHPWMNEINIYISRCPWYDYFASVNRSCCVCPSEWLIFMFMLRILFKPNLWSQFEKLTWYTECECLYWNTDVQHQNYTHPFWSPVSLI